MDAEWQKVADAGGFLEKSAGSSFTFDFVGAGRQRCSSNSAAAASTSTARYMPMLSISNKR